MGPEPNETDPDLQLRVAWNAFKAGNLTEDQRRQLAKPLKYGARRGLGKRDEELLGIDLEDAVQEVFKHLSTKDVPPHRPVASYLSTTARNYWISRLRKEYGPLRKQGKHGEDSDLMLESADDPTWERRSSPVGPPSSSLLEHYSEKLEALAGDMQDGLCLIHHPAPCPEGQATFGILQRKVDMYEEPEIADAAPASAAGEPREIGTLDDLRRALRLPLQDKKTREKERKTFERQAAPCYWWWLYRLFRNTEFDPPDDPGRLRGRVVGYWRVDKDWWPGQDNSRLRRVWVPSIPGIRNVRKFLPDYPDLKAYLSVRAETEPELEASRTRALIFFLEARR